MKNEFSMYNAKSSKGEIKYKTIVSEHRDIDAQ